jgi:hypothetical protein
LNRLNRSVVVDRKRASADHGLRRPSSSTAWPSCINPCHSCHSFSFIPIILGFSPHSLLSLLAAKSFSLFSRLLRQCWVRVHFESPRWLFWKLPLV